MGPCLFLPEHLICLFHWQTRWTMSVNNVGFKICLLGTSKLVVTLIVFPWCNPKWSWNEFNNQLHILHDLGMTSWSMV